MNISANSGNSGNDRSVLERKNSSDNEKRSSTNSIKGGSSSLSNSQQLNDSIKTSIENHNHQINESLRELREEDESVENGEVEEEANGRCNVM